MTPREKEQFNRMRAGLRAIVYQYETPGRIRATCQKAWGLEYEEALGMAYENLQSEARKAVKGVRLKR